MAWHCCAASLATAPAPPHARITHAVYRCCCLLHRAAAGSRILFLHLLAAAGACWRRINLRRAACLHTVTQHISLCASTRASVHRVMGIARAARESRAPARLPALARSRAIITRQLSLRVSHFSQRLLTPALNYNARALRQQCAFISLPWYGDRRNVAAVIMEYLLRPGRKDVVRHCAARAWLCRGMK